MPKPFEAGDDPATKILSQHNLEELEQLSSNRLSIRPEISLPSRRRQCYNEKCHSLEQASRAVYLGSCDSLHRTKTSRSAQAAWKLSQGSLPIRALNCFPSNYVHQYQLNANPGNGSRRRVRRVCLVHDAALFVVCEAIMFRWSAAPFLPPGQGVHATTASPRGERETP